MSETVAPSPDARTEARHETCDSVVIGGGIAGLFAAAGLSEQNVVLLEAADRLGGRVESVRRGDYWINVGAQFAEGDGPFIAMMDRLKIPRGSLAGTRAAFAWNGRVISSHNPANFVLRSKLSLRARIDLALLGLRLQRAYRRMLSTKKPQDAAAFREWLDSQPATVMASKVRTPEVRAIFGDWARHWVGADPEVQAASQFVIYMGSAMVKAAEVPNFSLPIGGNETLVEAMAEELGDRARTGCEVTKVTWDDDGVTVNYRDGQGDVVLRAKHCVVAMTADKVLEVMPDLEGPHREALEAIHYGRYVLAGMFTNETGPQKWDDLYAIATPGLTFQVIYNHAAALRQEGERKPGGALVCYAGGSKAAMLADKSDDEVRELYKQDLGKVYPELGRSVDEMLIKRVERVVPFWGPGKRLEARVLREPVGPIYFAGDYMGYPSMTTAAMSGDHAAKAILKR